MTQKKENISIIEKEENQNLNILIVEDDDGLSQLIQKTLQREGFETEVVFNGEDAIAKIVKNCESLILLDYLLPDMNGIDVIEKLAELKCTFPFIIMTGLGDENVAIKLMKLGALDYLIKDASFITLLPSVVKQVMKQLEAEINLKNAALEIKALKEFNEKIVQSLQEGVLLEDSNGYVVFANPKMSEMLGFSNGELIGAKWSKFVATEFHKRVEKKTRGTAEEMKIKYEVVFISQRGDKIPVLVSPTPMFENGSLKGILSVFTDISDIKQADERLIEKMMKYKIEKGNVYHAKEKKLEKGKDVFQDLMKCSFNGLVVTRTPPSKTKEAYGEDVPIIWLSEKRFDKMTVPPNFLIIEKTIENYLDHNLVVLFDRLDYLILKNGFEKTMEFIQRLSELVYIHQSILIISLDPEILEKNELLLLEKEVVEVKLKHEPDFPEDLYEILEFVYEENKRGKKPARKDIEKKFTISRTTARKRINKLKHLELVMDKEWGKYKILVLTDKGKTYF